MAKEKNLTAVTSVAAADFLRVVTSAGASVKATAANLAKYVIETYNGSSVAGSSQSVKDALDSLNSKTIISIRTNFTASTTLSYTGVSYTIPANSFYAINFNAVFLNYAPQEILLSKSASATSPYLVYAHNDAGSIVSVSGATSENLTLYVWARYNTASQNRIDIDGIIKSL